MAASSNSPAPEITLSSNEEGNRRGDILRAAGRLFREKGYNGTTIRDIAAAVNMRSGSPFYHFKTKHDMLLAIVIEGMQRIHDVVAAAAATQAEPKARLRAMIVAHLKALLDAEGCDFAAVVIRECAWLDPDAWASVQVQKDNYESLWRQVLAELADARVFRGDMHLTRLLLLGAMNWSTQWYRADGQCTPEALAAQLCELILGPESAATS